MMKMINKMIQLKKISKLMQEEVNQYGWNMKIIVQLLLEKLSDCWLIRKTQKMKELLEDLRLCFKEDKFLLE